MRAKWARQPGGTWGEGWRSGQPGPPPAGWVREAVGRRRRGRRGKTQKRRPAERFFLTPWRFLLWNREVFEFERNGNFFDFRRRGYLSFEWALHVAAHTPAGRT